MKSLPIGIQSIEKILSENYVYVDKTALLHALLSGAPFYFLSRPRRFGKSLLIDTLKAIFQGKKELFKECAIYSMEYDWKSHPIIHLDFSLIPRSSPKALEKALGRRLASIATKYEVHIAAPTLDEALIDLVHKLEAKTGAKVVVLVDEYDKPLIDHLKNPEIASGNRDVLKNFFAILKGLDAHLRFVFITGVSKFSQVSLFSGMNNVNDITISPLYASLLGYTEEEILRFFAEHLQNICKTTPTEIMDRMRQWYNGYRFSSAGRTVYNPFSTLLFLYHGTTNNYWFTTATPTFLIQQIKNQAYPVDQLSDIDVGPELFDSHDIDRISLISLMWQTGYLTIRNYDPEKHLYRLAYPNEEVKSSFIKHLAESVTEMSMTLVTGYAYRLAKAVQDQNLEVFFQILKTLFANIPYDIAIPAEKYYQSIFFVIMQLIGLDVAAEVTTNDGRIDLVIDTPATVYLFEFKIDSTPKKALQQIKDKKYFQKYLDASKEVILVGAGFSTKQRNISGWTATPAVSRIARMTTL